MNKKQLQLVTFEQAKRLKALGFDWSAYNFYDATQDNLLCLNPLVCFVSNHNKSKTKISAPTVALALKWFSDVKKIRHSVQINNGYYGFISGEDLWESKDFSTYESAESALLDELLTILEKEQ